MRVKAARPEADAKREWLEARWKVASEPQTLAELMALNDDHLTPERIVGWIAKGGAAMAGIAIWAPAEVLSELGLNVNGELVSAESYSDDHTRLARHSLQFEAWDGAVQAAIYEVTFLKSDDRAARTFKCLRDAYTEMIGKPRGSKTPSWTVLGAKLSMRIATAATTTKATCRRWSSASTL